MPREGDRRHVPLQSLGVRRSGIGRSAAARPLLTPIVRRRTRVIVKTIRLPPPNDAPPLERSAGLGHHSTLMFDMIVIVEKDHHPIVGTSEQMGQRGVGKHCREMPLASRGLQQRQPGITFRIASARRLPTPGAVSSRPACAAWSSPSSGSTCSVL